MLISSASPNLLKSVLTRITMPLSGSRSNHAERSKPFHPHPDGIYVQILPTLIPSDVNSSSPNLPSRSLEKWTHNKILLCKWTSGDFKDRYTGLIKSLPSTDYNTLLSHQQNDNHSEKYSLLDQFAKNLLPSSISNMVRDIRLVALLRFEDDPVYDEYVYIANLVPRETQIEELFKRQISFDDHPCHWFSWEEIPFPEMPQDDEIWYPKVLQGGEKVQGSFTFGGWSEKTLKSFELHTVSSIE